MAEFAQRSGIAVEVATFEAWDSAGRDFDAVVAGMSWHWVEPVGGAAQVLRPGGLFAALHHVFQYPAEILEPLIAVFQQVALDTPINIPVLRRAVDAYQQLFATIAGGLRQAGAFSEPEQWQSGWEQTYTRDEWLEQMPTHNRLNLLPPDDLATVLERTGAAIDAISGSFHHCLYHHGRHRRADLSVGRHSMWRHHDTRSEQRRDRNPLDCGDSSMNVGRLDLVRDNQRDNPSTVTDGVRTSGLLVNELAAYRRL